MQTAIQIHALETITRQLPQIVKQLERIANALEDIDKTTSHTDGVFEKLLAASEGKVKNTTETRW